MTRLCPACHSRVPDLPTEQPLAYCSASCRDRVEAAAVRFLDAVASAEPTDGEGTTP